MERRGSRAPLPSSFAERTQSDTGARSAGASSPWLDESAASARRAPGERPCATPGRHRDLVA
ncbi:hypothetical protein SCE1572_29090 [Sorangium cellulosum So0157-2]|uniref:Uncharacterized protein n=1 Tax=Sorangium cellulosum So0157-2 TaxID=1254432 RepID=S4Y097_SORCE|nr:hypothetical protein SCE1572_29090 [Sorangium cellulosum So0157-2]